MLHLMNDMRKLSRLLEAECDGLPFDRAEARELAARLAQDCPAMGQTMLRISERMVAEAC